MTVKLQYLMLDNTLQIKFDETDKKLSILPLT